MSPVAGTETSFTCHICGWTGTDHELLAGPGAPTCPDCGAHNFVAER